MSFSVFACYQSVNLPVTHLAAAQARLMKQQQVDKRLRQQSD